MAAHQLGAIQFHMIQQVWLINPNADEGEYDKGEECLNSTIKGLRAFTIKGAKIIQKLF